MKSGLWRHTPDGQWQKFEGFSGKIQASKQGIYKASALATGSSQKSWEEQTKQIPISSVVWTPKGYGTLESRTEGQCQVKLASETVTMPEADVRKRIEVNLRVVNGQKLQWLRAEFGVNAKLEDVANLLSACFEKSIYMVALSHGGKALDKKTSISDSKIGHGAIIMGLLGAGKPKIFRRFKQIANSYWYVSTSWDALLFKSERPLLVMGFGVYKQYYTDTYAIKYKFYVEDKQIFAETRAEIKPHMLKEKVAGVKLKHPVRVPANTEFTVMYIFESCEGHDNHAHYGENGDDYKDIEGNDKFIEVVYSNRDQNGTGVSSGQVPELHYIPL